ncbi:GtrA family protein [Rhodopseudomonas sp. HC1]|uniref:GtrA family protein n=1 Tax=Rhodopseudomonas infernalis TaxID=2897386 RepID=UPI001EE8E4AA|nr:GtrA family protein [Rhodopseudomonas infernalis]MCG6205029.1 GtrA family protein [Rhodopseudomonas infernalis]
MNGRIEAVATSRFVRFLLVGGAAAAINIGSRVVISKFVAFEYAVALAFPIALTFAFVMSRWLVFERAGSSAWGQYLRFFLVNLVALVQVWLVSVGLAQWLFPMIGWILYPELVAHTIAVCSPVLTSYYAHKLFTFK